MEAKSLRIGNLVNVSLSSGNGRTVIRKIGYADLQRISENTGSYIYKPIPITEEWLIKFGFTQHPDIDYRYTTENDYFIYDLDDNCFCVVNTWIEPKVKYVHSLQNLIYALTGEELTIKQ